MASLKNLMIRLGIEVDPSGAGSGLAKLQGMMEKASMAVGIASGVALTAGLTEAINLSGSRGKIQAQLGVTADESKRIGSVAGKLFSNAYGGSMEEVNTAITSVIQNMDGMRGASSNALEQTTAKAITTATVLGEDVGKTTQAVAQIMRTGLAKNSSEAFDILTRGAQLGGNKAQDLLDTFVEYSTQFRSMGLSGQTAMGLINQGLQGGARNADLVADTIKEFSIEAVAGGARVRGGFQSLGLNADQMVAKFAKGGPTAAKAFDTVLDKLRGIEDPAKRNAVAIELFGTKAEDMGAALFKLDPSKAINSLNGVAGAADKAGKAMGDTAQARLQTFTRTVQTNVVHALDGLISKFNALSPETQAMITKFATIGAVALPAAFALVKVGQATVATVNGIKSVGSAVGAAGPKMLTFAKFMGNGVVASSQMAGSLLSSAAAMTKHGIATAGAATKTVIMTAAQKASTVASKLMAAGIWLVNVAMRANPIGIIITLITGLIAIVVLAYKKNETFRKIVDAVWKGIQAAIKFAVDRVIKPVIQWLYNFIVRDLGPKFMWFHNTVVRPVMTKIGEIVRVVIDKVKSHFMFMHKLITQTIPNAFKTGVAAIGRFWDKVKEIAKKPVTFLVNTVYNNGIRKVWNWVASKVGLGQLDAISGFARGGVLSGYSRKDDQLIAARSGESIFVPEFTKAVGPDWVYGMNALARRGGPRAVAKAMTGGGNGIPGFQNGGIVGFIGGFFKKAKDFFVNGFVKAAQGALNPIVNVMQNAVGGTAFGQMLVKAVSNIIQNVINRFKPFESELGGGDATGVVKAAARYIGQGDRGRDNDNKFNDRWGWPAGTPWCANFVSTAIADAKAQKKYKGFPTAAVYGYWSRMNKVGVGNARPGDLGVYYGPTGHINIVSKKLGGNSFETIGGNEGPVVRRAVRSSAYSILRPGAELGGIVQLKKIFQQRNEDKADRRNPMRMLMAGDLKPFKFDNGGMWEPGTMGVNTTREPEAVFNAQQWRKFEGGQGDTLVVNNYIAPGAADVRKYEEGVYRAFVNYKKRNRGTRE